MDIMQNYNEIKFYIVCTISIFFYFQSIIKSLLIPPDMLFAWCNVSLNLAAFRANEFFPISSLFSIIFNKLPEFPSFYKLILFNFLISTLTNYSYNHYRYYICLWFNPCHTFNDTLQAQFIPSTWISRLKRENTRSHKLSRINRRTFHALFKEVNISHYPGFSIQSKRERERKRADGCVSEHFPGFSFARNTIHRFHNPLPCLTYVLM